MSFRVLLRPEAEVDISDAATWYENQRGGLGGEFLEAVFQRLTGSPPTLCSPPVAIGAETSGGFFRSNFPTT
jgi:hypothetical protein